MTTTAVSRRQVLRLAGGAAGLAIGAAAGAIGDAAAAAGGGTGGGAAGARAPAGDDHRPVLRLPAETSNGAKVPIVVDMAHPMEPDHHVTSLHVVNERDPVPSKGVYHFTPASGRVRLAFQVRLDGGPSTVAAVAACNRHGPVTTLRSTHVADGGGCAGTAPARLGPGEIRPPVLRIPAVVAGVPVRRGDIIDVQLKIKHPVRTGLLRRDGGFVRGSDPLYLETLEVFYGAGAVSRFLLTPALSDDPFITFSLRADREAAVHVVLANNRGQRFEAAHPIRLG